MQNRNRFFDSVLVASLIRRAKFYDDAAVQLLLIAAEYMRNREPLPYGLDDYLASAIETAVHSPAKCDPYNADTGAALLVGLSLKRMYRPATVDPFEVCAFMENEMLTFHGAPKQFLIAGADEHGNKTEIDISPANQAEAARRAAKYFGVSETTIKRIFRESIQQYTEVNTMLPPDVEEVEWLAQMEKQERKK